MNSAELKNKISDLRPNYSDKYRSMIETISNKQERIGKGNIAQFGPYFQTFMYACVIGLRLGSPNILNHKKKHGNLHHCSDGSQNLSKTTS